jgi:hypothetical protein
LSVRLYHVKSLRKSKQVANARLAAADDIVDRGALDPIEGILSPNLHQDSAPEPAMNA